MNAPKFKVGDMVMFSQSLNGPPVPAGCVWADRTDSNGMISTVSTPAAVDPNGSGYWCYQLENGYRAREPFLHLIKGGDVQTEADRDQEVAA